MLPADDETGAFCNGDKLRLPDKLIEPVMDGE